MKVKDLIKMLKDYGSEQEIVLTHLAAKSQEVMKKIRVYAQEGRMIVDGWEQENNRGRKNDN